MKQLATTLRAALAALPALVAFAMVAVPALVISAADMPDGKEVFLAQKCNICHAVSSAGIEATTASEKMKGPDLIGVGDRHDNDKEWFVKFVKREVELDGSLHKKPYKGTDEELAALIDWLLEQKAVD